MSSQPVNHYGRFALGILVGVVILAALWYGSGYEKSTTTEEMAARIFSIYGGAAGFATISLIAIVNRVIPVFYPAARRNEPLFFTNGLIVSVAINGLYLVLTDVTRLPYLEI